MPKGASGDCGLTGHDLSGKPLIIPLSVSIVVVLTTSTSASLRDRSSLTPSLRAKRLHLCEESHAHLRGAHAHQGASPLMGVLIALHVELVMLLRFSFILHKPIASSGYGPVTLYLY